MSLPLKHLMHSVFNVLILLSVAKASSINRSSSTCTNPFTYSNTGNPNGYSAEFYNSFRQTCTDKCNAAGFCCTKATAGCEKVPCNEGCHIAFFSSDVAACKAECTAANEPGCEYEHNKHDQVSFIGDYFVEHFSVGKCGDARTCGCNRDTFGPPNDIYAGDCSADACLRGCELANEADIRDSSYNGENAFIDSTANLSKSEFVSAVASIKSHIQGSSTATNSKLRSALDTIGRNSALVGLDFDCMDSAFSLIDAYESRYGGMFINSRTDSSGFPRDDQNDGYTLDRVILAVQQVILDTVYFGTYDSDEPDQYELFRESFGVIQNCKDYLRGRYWETSVYFPGFVGLAPSQPTTIHSFNIKATVPKYWGKEECFSTYPAIHASGLYIPPGGVAWIIFPSTLVNKDFKVQVGANDVDTIIKDNQLRMNRVTSTFDIRSTKTFLSSPLGGGIYIKVPYLANYGTQQIKVSGDVIKAPFFSMTNLKTTTSTEWNTLKNSLAPWADFETEYYMQVVPTSWILNYSYIHFKNLLEKRDEAMKAYDYISGYPDGTKNKQIAYFGVDLHIRANSYGVGYPQVNHILSSGPNGIIANPDHVLVSDPTFESFATDFHELGHCTYTYRWSGYEGDTEAIVNFPYAYIQAKVLGKDLTDAFRLTMDGDTGDLTPDMASVDWMISYNFRNGNEMGTDDPDEFRYQPRGYAKYADICTLFGCDKLYAFYYEEHTYANNGDYDYGRPNGFDDQDWRTLRLSIHVGYDLTPLMHFWGVHPANSAKLKASMETNNLQVSSNVYNLIKYRIDEILPKNNAEFLDFFSVVWPGWDTSESQWWGCREYCCSECGLYYQLKDVWNVSMANQAKKVGENILSLYYDDVTPPTVPTPTAPTPTPMTQCIDSTVRFKLVWNKKKIARYCVWVANKQTEARCAVDGVSALCADTCGTCSLCQDSTLRMRLLKNGQYIMRSCIWVAKKQTEARCAMDGVANSCRASCGQC